MFHADVFRRLQQNLDWRARLLAQGQYEALATTYLFPVQARLGQLSFVITSREDLILQIHRKRIALEKQGFSLPRPQLLAADLHPVNGVRRAWVRWVAMRGEEERESFSIFGFVEQAGTFFLTSMQYETLMLPEFEKKSAHRRLKYSR